MVLYRVSGQIDLVVLEPRRGWQLKQMQDAVGGYIERVPGSEDRGGVAFCNEEGRLIGLPVNNAASRRFGQVLVGDVLELDATEFTATEGPEESMAVTDQEDTSEHTCDDCGKTYERDEILPLDRDWYTLVTEDDIVPSGVCPFCGSFTFRTPSQWMPRSSEAP
jgi:hypothetical protein